MLFRLLLNSADLPNLNSTRAMERYCEPVLETLKDENKSLEVFNKSFEIIEIADFDYADKQQIKQGIRTQILVDGIKKR